VAAESGAPLTSGVGWPIETVAAVDSGAPLTSGVDWPIEMESAVLVAVDVDSAVRECQSPGLSGRVRFRTVGSFRGVGGIFFLAGGLISGASEADDIVRDGCRKLMAPWLPTAAFMLSKKTLSSAF